MLNFAVTNLANKDREVYVWYRVGNQLSLYKDKSFFPYYYQADQSGLFKAIDGQKVKKIVCSKPFDVGKNRDERSYEADVLFTKRYAIDKLGTFMKANLKYSFVDIEVLTKDLPSPLNPDKPISCISASNSYTEEIKTFFLNNYLDPRIAVPDYDVSEKKLLTDFVQWMKEQQFDFILGWNFLQFDYDYLRARYQYLFGVELADMLSPIASNRHLGENRLIPQGLGILDYLDMYKKIYRTKVSYALDAIAQEELKEKSFAKIDFSKLSSEIKEKNINDVRRMIDIEKKLKIIEYYDELRRMSKCDWTDLTWNSKILDIMLLAEAKQKGIVLPSKKYGQDIEVEDTFEGAYRRCNIENEAGEITEHLTGLYKNLWKLDLSSAYPMAIIEFCLDIGNIREEGTDVNGIKFYQNSNALLPALARKLVNKKDELKKQLKALTPDTEEYKDLQLKYDAVKAVVNSLFGVCGLKVFRLFNPKVAASITFLIRDLLKYVEDKLQEQGMKVVYIDTDSVFVQAKDNPKDLCNALVKQWAKEKYNKDTIGIEFDLEGIFEKILIVALCHYKGYLKTKSGIKEEIKGIETKRKDSSVFIRDFQNVLIEKVMNEESREAIERFIASQKEAIKTRPLTEVGFPCKISQEAESYKSVPIFVRGYQYTTEITDFKKNLGDTFWWIYVNSFGTSMRKSSRMKTNKETKEKTLESSEKEISKDVLCFDEEKQDHIKSVGVDWTRIIERSITGKVDKIFEAMNWINEDVSKKRLITTEEATEKVAKSTKRRKKESSAVDNLTSSATIKSQPTFTEQDFLVEKKITHAELAEQFAKDCGIKEETNYAEDGLKDECENADNHVSSSEECLASANVLPKVDIMKEQTFTISHSFKTKADITQRTIQVAEAFGLGIDDEKTFTLYDNIPLNVKSGDIIYITGDSGSGKSWMLQNIFAKLPNAISINDLKIDENEVIVEGVGKNINDALMKLNIAGLGDAFLYLRKYSQLSDGQKYRYRIAKFIDQEKDVWILDEFCATLDRVTAKVVAYNLQKIARKLSKTVIVATTHTDLLEEFRPTTFVQKGYESDIVIKYYNYSKTWGDLSFYKDIKLSLGTKEDYEKLKRFHYRQAALGALKTVYKCTYKDELIGVIVICYPHLALKGRNIALANKYAKMTKENCEALNREFDSIARVIIHPKFRGIGLAQVMLKDYFKLTTAIYTETLAVMANYSPFFERAGMTRINVDADDKRVESVKQLENFGFNISLLSSARYNEQIFNSLNEAQKVEVKNIVRQVLNRYKGQIAKLFTKEDSVDKIIEEHLFEAMRELQRANTVYLIKKLK